MDQDFVERGTLLVVSGPSGVGKTTICRKLADRLDAFLSVSMTTRPKRSGEVDGGAYCFVTTEEFERRIELDRVLEYARVYGGHYYGTSAEPVFEALDAGRTVILEIEIEGTLQVKRRLPEAVAVYLLAPNAGEQESRLVGRRQDSAEAMAERLSKADGEIRYAHECGAYDHFVVNDDVEETVQRLERIVQQARSNQ